MTQPDIPSGSDATASRNIRITRTSTGYRVHYVSPAEEAASDWAAIGVCVIGLIAVKALVIALLA